MDPDTRFAVRVAPIGGALGAFAERLVTHLKAIPTLAGPAQIAYFQDKWIELVIYVLVAAIVTTAAIMLFPINRQNRPQLIGTAIVFGLVWPSVLDRLLVIAGVAVAAAK